jgi:hypothetical protein
LGIGIFDSQYQFAAGLLSKKPVKNSCASAADMQVSGGTWRKANDNVLFHVNSPLLDPAGKPAGLS